VLFIIIFIINININIIIIIIIIVGISVAFTKFLLRALSPQSSGMIYQTEKTTKNNYEKNKGRGQLIECI